MDSMFTPNRYHCITIKNPREIVMLRGSGCKWRRCRFCDYHLDYSKDEDANYALNLKQLEKVTGCYQKLEVINSGSFCDLDSKTIAAILQLCQSKHISEVHFECHWMHREAIASFRALFQKHGITLKIKIGVETFDVDFREQILVKGMPDVLPLELARYADEVCLLFGLEGQTISSMKRDIEIGLTYFERICINIMIANTTAVKPCEKVISLFKETIYPLYVSNPRVDILLNNTDFGVGGHTNE